MMGRVEIKEWSKEKIQGNKWEIWSATLLVVLISFGASIIISLFGENNSLGGIIAFVVEMFLIPLEIGLVDYFIKFVRNGETDKSLILDHYFEIWKILGTMLLMAIVVSVGFIFFIIPGIILAYSYLLVPYLLIERKDLTIIETLKLSRKMMNGHKLDFFIFSISFIGWQILAPFTLGILYIWLYPYMIVATTKFLVETIDSYEG